MRTLQLVLLYGALLVAVLFLMRACAPDKPPEGEAGVQPRLDSFDAIDAPAEQTFVLETDVLRLEWSSRGAGCVRAALRRREDFHNERGEAPWMPLFAAVPAYGPTVACESAQAVHHRRRDALQLSDPEGALGVDPRALDWTVTGPLALPDGGQELRFQADTPKGLRLLRSVRAAPGQLHVEVEDRIEVLDAQLTGRDLALRLATGGGMLREPDAFYANPYVAAPVLQGEQIDSMEVLTPSGKLPPVRALAARWQGQVPFVVEGSKYYVSCIRPLDGAFEGATAEVLFDAEAYEHNVLAGLSTPAASAMQSVARADAEAYAAHCRRATPEELAQGSALAAAEAMALRDQYYVRAAKAREKAWTRASVAGHYRMHVGQPGETVARRFQWYLGPKDPKQFSAPAYQAYQAIVTRVDYGQSFFYRAFFTQYIAWAILKICELFHFLARNWGLAIILMTILVRALLFPVNRRSQVKMAEYQAKVARLKPELDAVKKKYANNPQKLNEEQFRLYREHRISPPFGGCLPILLQFPVFIGLFAALRCSILLREEPFLLWMHDLSRPDALIDFGGPILDFWPLRSVVSLNILPILMVVVWVLQQRAMPKPSDPQQAQMQKIMLFMPVVFGLMLYNYAAGLSLYMITSSALGIFESQVIRKRWPVAVPGAAPAKA